MKPRRIFQGVLLTALLTVALWAAGASSASMQVICGDLCPPPPPCPSGNVLCTPVSCDSDVDCTTEAAPFTPDADSWTFIFDANNSIKISTTVITPFLLKVDRIAMTQADFTIRTTGTPFSTSQCWPTLLTDVSAPCVFYRVHGEAVDRSFYGPQVEYIVGFTTPPIVGNKHDFMLLRSSAASFPVPYPLFLSTFDQEITTKVLRNYDPGVKDPGIGGGADGFSDYTVAYQRNRPVSK